MCREKYFNQMLFIFFIFLLANDLIIFKFSLLGGRGRNKRTTIDNDKDYYQQKDSLKVFQSVKTEIDYAQLNYCSQVPSRIKGTRLRIDKLPANFSATTNELDFNSTQEYHTVNGRWLPVNCKARHRVAIIIPYKNR